MKQKIVVDERGKKMLVTAYLDGSVMVSMIDESRSFPAGHPVASALSSVVSQEDTEEVKG